MSVVYRGSADGSPCYICMRIEDLEGSGIPQPRLRRRSGTRVPASRRSPSPARLDLASRLRPMQGALRSRLSRADTLADVTRAVNATLDPERVADAIVACAADWLPVPSWVVYIDDNSGVRTLGARGIGSALEASAAAVGHWVLKHGDVCSASDVAADERFEGGASVAALGIPLDNAMLVQRAEALSVTDDLTQLYNSRYMTQVLRRETKRASRSGRPLSLLFIDLDGFKRINDTYGHLYGSRALVEAGALIRQCARETDVVARFGGDEFALILPDTGSEGAAAVGERIRDRVNAHAFLQGLEIHLTVSVGVATLPDVAASADGLVQAAAEAMYHVT